MNELTVDDVKQLLLDVYLLQKEVVRLREQLAEREAPEGRKDGVLSDHH